MKELEYWITGENLLAWLVNPCWRPIMLLHFYHYIHTFESILPICCWLTCLLGILLEHNFYTWVSIFKQFKIPKKKRNLLETFSQFWNIFIFPIWIENNGLKVCLKKNHNYAFKTYFLPTFKHSNYNFML
jgi:hypothetical protein